MIIIRIYSGPKAGREYHFKINEKNPDLLVLEYRIIQCRLDRAVWKHDLRFARKHERFWWKHLMEMHRFEQDHRDYVQDALDWWGDDSEATLSMSA